MNKNKKKTQKKKKKKKKKKRQVSLVILTPVVLKKLRWHAHFQFSAIRLFDPGCLYKFTYLMTNSADPDQLASSEAN